MTYSTSHLGIGTILVYFFLPKSSKDYLKNNPNVFFLTSLGAILPDLDLFTNGHRAYGHTIFLPLLIMIFAPALEKYMKRRNLSKNLRYFGIFWLTHLLYDTTFGPMALFYPIDPRFYDIQVGLVFILTTAIIAPGGFFVSVDIIDQRNGINTFFVNWTAEDRVNYFGSSEINFPISDFFLHSTIFLWYVLFVIVPYVKLKRGLFEKEENDIEPSRIEIRIKPWLTIILLTLLTTSFFLAGPYHGQSWVDSQEDNSSVYVLTDTIQFVGSKSYLISEDSSLDLLIKANTENFNYSIFTIELPRDQIEEITQTVSDEIELYQNSVITYNQLLQNYQELIQNNIPEEHAKQVEVNEQVSWEFSSSKNLNILFGLYDWNTSLSFINTLSFETRFNVDISQSYFVGLVFTIISFVCTIVLIINKKKGLNLISTYV